MHHHHAEIHASHRIGWLRASVLGANDGAVSVASLLVGVAASGASEQTLFLTGIAALVAGAMSMAAGEYVSVQSQLDTEIADLARERTELVANPAHELAELTAIYVARGLDKSLAGQVAAQLTGRDALAAHARDELGITDTLHARPLQAALASALAFATGALPPMAAAMLAPHQWVGASITVTALLVLAALGATSAYVGGAPMARAAWRVVFWGALAMGMTALVGRLFGANI